jgi:hypothetical protein
MPFNGFTRPMTTIERIRHAKYKKIAETRFPKLKYEILENCCMLSYEDCDKCGQIRNNYEFTTEELYESLRAFFNIDVFQHASELSALSWYDPPYNAIRNYEDM